MIQDVFNEEILKPKKKKTIKATTILSIIIILLLICCVITIVFIVYFNGAILSITLDGSDAKELQKVFIFEENNKVYMPIRRMASYLKYDSYNGDYITLSEDATKCYIKNDEELVSFTLDSNILTKIVEEETKQIKIEEPIKEINGELCITAEGAQDAFNFRFYYDTENNKIIIQTLSYLYTGYSRMYQNQKGYLPIQETFVNKTAIYDGMLIVKSQDGKYGVISTNEDGTTILETKYDGIDYLPGTSDFLVEGNGKKGIITKEGATKVELVYDDIKTFTNNNQTFYIMEQSKLYGLLDTEGKILLYPEYEQIGINITAYERNGITNGYVFSDTLVPLQRNSKWGLYNLKENKLSDFVYDSFGCPTGPVARTYGVLQIPEYNIILGEKSKKYNLITAEGKGSNFIFDSVYISISEGKDKYYAVINGETKDLITFLQENGIVKTLP